MLADNLINRLLLHLIYPWEISTNDALEQSQACYDNYVENTIEAVFDLFEHYDIRINELKIDLGAVVPEEIPHKLRTALEKELKKRLRETKWSDGITDVISDTKVDTDDTAGEREMPVIDDPFSCFLEYLKNPQAPWYSGSDIPFDIESIAIEAAGECLSKHSCFESLVSVISQERRLYRRFVHLVKTDTLDLIIRRYITTNRTSYKAIYMDLYTRIDTLLSHYPSYKKEVREWFFEYLLYTVPSKQQTELSGFRPIINRSENEYLFHDSTGSDNEAVYRLLQRSGFLPEGKDTFSPVSGNEPFHSLIRQQRLLTEEKDRSSAGESNEPSHRRMQQRESLPEKKEIKMKSGKDVVQYLSRRYKNSKVSFQDDSRFTETGQEDKQRFFIRNAGLVIFNPLIPAFFKHLGYLDKESHFKSIRHRVRAVHLLQALTGVQLKHYDHLLQLNKIICGLDTGFPIDPVFRITKREKEEANDLLESVMVHWSVLEGTSIGGFQESFVQREGVIEKNGRDWIVHVENKSIDILLDDLPWSIHLLSFPWNDFVIHVDWKRS